MTSALKPPHTVYHGTDSSFEKFDLETCLGAHFGTRQAAIDRLRSTHRLKIDYQCYPSNGAWIVREQNWSNKPAFEHGPFEDQDAAECFILSAPQSRTPLAFEIDVYKPLELSDLGVWTFETMLTHLGREHRERFEHNLDRIWSAWNRSSTQGWTAIKAAIKEAGYDCIAYRNETEDPGSISWIVMDADKIHAKWRPENNEAHIQWPRMRA
jgi:hypothetical protein